MSLLYNVVFIPAVQPSETCILSLLDLPPLTIKGSLELKKKKWNRKELGKRKATWYSNWSTCFPTFIVNRLGNVSLISILSTLWHVYFNSNILWGWAFREVFRRTSDVIFVTHSQDVCVVMRRMQVVRRMWAIHGSDGPSLLGPWAKSSSTSGRGPAVLPSPTANNRLAPLPL